MRYLIPVLALFLAGVAPASATTTASPVEAPVVMHALGESGNWAGYVATGGTFTYVRAAWTEPTVTCTAATPHASSFWVGIDGYFANSGTLEQVGTDADCNGPNQPVYYAWYEFIPAGSVALPARDAVRPGDKISASVTASGTTYTVAIKDWTAGWHYSTHQRIPAAQGGSAEWIAEAPSICGRISCRVVPLANFTKVNFASAAATTTGPSKTITGFAHTGIEMVTDSGAPRAKPSALSNQGTVFDVTWNHA